MDEQTREAALRFWNEQVTDRKNSCYGDIVRGALMTLEHFHLEGEGGFEALGLALREETVRRITTRAVKRRKASAKNAGHRSRQL